MDLDLERMDVYHLALDFWFSRARIGVEPSTPPWSTRAIQWRAISCVPGTGTGTGGPESRDGPLVLLARATAASKAISEVSGAGRTGQPFGSASADRPSADHALLAAVADALNAASIQRVRLRGAIREFVILGLTEQRATGRELGRHFFTVGRDLQIALPLTQLFRRQL